MRKTHSITVVAATAGLLAALGSADAEISRAIHKEFRGQILVTAGELPAAAGNHQATVAAYRKAIQRTVTHSEVRGVPTWSFHYTAFLNRPPGVDALAFDFYTDDRENRYVATRRLMGIDPKLTILQGRLSITEDDNLLPGRNYVVRLTGQVRGRTVVFAETKLTTK